MIVELTKEFYFEAAHKNLISQGVGSRLHGHSFRAEIVVEGEVDPALGWLIDYGDLKRLFQPVYDQLDHHYLNELKDIGDASLEDIEAWIGMRLQPTLPMLKDVRISIVGDNAFRPAELPPDAESGLPRRVRFTFEAAQSLPHLPEDHPCRRLHGHSYRVEVGAQDLAKLWEPLQSLHNALDHRCLNDITELNEATSERLCAWIWDRLSAEISDLLVVAVQETATARCVYYGR